MVGEAYSSVSSGMFSKAEMFLMVFILKKFRPAGPALISPSVPLSPAIAL
jgi:hypothetical protein